MRSGRVAGILPWWHLFLFFKPFYLAVGLSAPSVGHSWRSQWKWYMVLLLVHPALCGVHQTEKVDVIAEDYGFKHIMWVYSGRRGVHCWVGDKRARKLSEESRKALVSYLEVIKGGEQQLRKVNLPNQMHASLSYSHLPQIDLSVYWPVLKWKKTSAKYTTAILWQSDPATAGHLG